MTTRDTFTPTRHGDIPPPTRCRFVHSTQRCFNGQNVGKGGNGRIISGEVNLLAGKQLREEIEIRKIS